MQQILFFFLFCFCILTIPVGFKRLTCGFKLAKIQLDAPYQSDWEISSDINVKHILSQQFTYLNRGAQSYVFVSEDGQYVVKFFRFDRLKGPREKIINELFSACKLAFMKAKEETGLLFVHLNPTHDRLPLMHLRGPLGQNFTLCPDEYRFVIQKRVDSFQNAMKGSPEQVRKRLDSFLMVLNSRLDKGLRNSDSAVVRNFGFLGDQAVEIDFGNYSEKPSSKEKEFAQYARKLRAWLQENAAEWVEYFDAAIHH